MKKRITSILLAICMIAAVLPFNALAAGTEGTIDNPWTSGGVKVYRDAGTLYVFGSGAMSDYSTASAVPWYKVSGGIDTIVIESGVESLGKNAFAACGSVSDVRLKRDMTIKGGLDLAENALPANFKCELELCGEDYMPDYNNNAPWSNLKTHIVSVTVDEGVKSIGKQAFASLINLQTVVIPSTAEYIGAEAFADCIKLTDVTLRHSFDGNKASGTPFTIGTNAFPVGNSGFRIAMEITGTEAVPDYASANEQPWANIRDYIKTLVIGGDVAGIGDNAFSGCTKLSNVTMYFYENGGKAEKKLGTDWFREHDVNASVNVVAVSADLAFDTWSNSTFANPKSANTIYFYNRNPLTLYAYWDGVDRGITVKPADNKDYGKMAPGYEPLPAYEITVKNSSNVASGQLHVELSGGNTNAFTLSKKYIGSLPVMGTSLFTVTPVTGLSYGDYTTAVVVSDENQTIATFRVTFHVTTPAWRASEIVKRLYTDALNRPEYRIDEDEYNAWVNALLGGASVATVGAEFYGSKEFRDRGVDNKTFVDSLYRTLLNREPDAGGEAIWLDCLLKGYTRSWVFEQFCESEEFKALIGFYELIPGTINPDSYDMGQPSLASLDANIKGFVTRLYQIVLDREPEDAGLIDWTTQLMSGRNTGAGVASGFFGSQEYMNRQRSNLDFLTDLYRAILDRKTAPYWDEAGRDHWLGYMEQGYSRAWIFNQFCISQEFSDLCNFYGITPGSINVEGMDMGTGNADNTVKVDKTVAEEFVKSLYVNILGRDPANIKADELKGWVDLLVNGTDTAATVAAGVASGPEAVNLKRSNEEFVKGLYRALLGSDADTVGINGWVDSLNGGTKRSVVFKAITDSSQFKDICNTKGLSAGTIDPNAYSMGDIVTPKVSEVNAEAYINFIYNTLLSRGSAGADAEGMATWKPQIMDGSASAAQMCASLAVSAEFMGKGYNNQQFVEILYRALLNTDPATDTDGVNAWVESLNGGTKRNVVFKSIIDGKQFKDYCASMGVIAGTINAGAYNMG